MVHVIHMIHVSHIPMIVHAIHGHGMVHPIHFHIRIFRRFIRFGVMPIHVLHIVPVTVVIAYIHTNSPKSLHSSRKNMTMNIKSYAYLHP